MNVVPQRGRAHDQEIRQRARLACLASALHQVRSRVAHAFRGPSQAIMATARARMVPKPVRHICFAHQMTQQARQNMPGARKSAGLAVGRGLLPSPEEWATRDQILAATLAALINEHAPHLTNRALEWAANGACCSRASPVRQPCAGGGPIHSCCATCPAPATSSCQASPTICPFPIACSIARSWPTSTSTSIRPAASFAGRDQARARARRWICAPRRWRARGCRATSSSSERPRAGVRSMSFEISRRSRRRISSNSDDA